MTDCRFCRGERPAADHKVVELSITVAYLVWTVPHAPRQLGAAALGERLGALRARLSA
jgi:hypothetical protein